MTPHFAPFQLSVRAMSFEKIYIVSLLQAYNSQFMMFIQIWVYTCARRKKKPKQNTEKNQLQSFLSSCKSDDADERNSNQRNFAARSTNGF